MMDCARLITILGPTASGKTSLAVALASHLMKREGKTAEIISADSRQVYRGMDIGTGKDLEDYTIDGKQIPYHLIDICEPGTKYNLFEYQQDFHNVYEDILNRDVIPIFCGGSGLYIEAVLRGYTLSPVPRDESLRERLAAKSLPELTQMLAELKHRNGSEMHNRSDVDTVQRAIRAIEIEEHNLRHPQPERILPAIDSLVIGILIDREERRRRITKRLKARLEHGLVEEVQGLMARGLSEEDLTYYGLEYKYVTEYVVGKISYEEMFRTLEIAIHQFAKRQMTWFRGMERRGVCIHWMEPVQPMEETISKIEELWQ